MIKPDGKEYGVADHTGDLGTVLVRKRLHSEIRFRVYAFEAALIFETLRKQITVKQKNTMLRYIKWHKDSTRILISINRVDVETDPFKGESISVVTKFIIERTENA